MLNKKSYLDSIALYRRRMISRLLRVILLLVIITSIFGEVNNSMAQSPSNPYVYRVSTTASLCGDLVALKLIPNDTNHTLTAEVTKCDGKPFAKSGQLYIEVDLNPDDKKDIWQVNWWKMLTKYQAGTLKITMSFDPYFVKNLKDLAIYRAKVLPDGDTPKYTGSIKAWGGYKGLKLPYLYGSLSYKVFADGPTGHVRTWSNGQIRHAVDFATDGKSIKVPAMYSGIWYKSSGSTGDGGYMVAIDHQDGFCSVYLHLDSASHTIMENGTYVRQGQVIALSGNTGRTVPAGSYVLHVAVIKKASSCLSYNHANEVIMLFPEAGEKELAKDNKISSQNKPRYDYQLVSESTIRLSLKPGKTTSVYFKVKNTGSETWDKRYVKLGTDKPRDHAGIFYTPNNWLSTTRIAFKEDTVPPVPDRDIATFEFQVTAPKSPGTKVEFFQLKTAEAGWLAYGTNMSVTVTVMNSTAASNSSSDNLIFLPIIIKTP